MSGKLTGTKKQKEELLKELKILKDVEGGFIMALQKAQDIYKYLPRDVVELIAREMKTTPSELYGVATFYSQFNLNPIGKYKISVCMGTACYVKGAGDVLDKVKQSLKIDVGETTADGLFSIEASRCVGCCGLAPIMSVGEDIYGRIQAKEVPEILEKYKANGTL